MCYEYKSINGLAIEPEWSIWFELFRDAFVNRLDKLGFANEDDFVALLKVMDQYENIGHFLDDAEDQQAEVAAYGLIVFDRIMMAEKTGATHADVFAMHQELTECYTPELHTFFKSEQARRGAYKSHEKNMRPRAWVLSEWTNRPDQNQGKAAFARQYSPLVMKRFGVRVNPDTIARDWLPKAEKKPNE